jgi:hypothetical protein
MAALADAIRLAGRSQRLARDTNRSATSIPPYAPLLVRSVGNLAARLRAGEDMPDLSPELAQSVAAGIASPIAAATIARSPT